MWSQVLKGRNQTTKKRKKGTGENAIPIVLLFQLVQWCPEGNHFKGATNRAEWNYVESAERQFITTPDHSEEVGRELGGSLERHLLRKIWVWFRAVRFVMCRQPQQKSGSKQPWSNRYDHQTEEAMPLARTGKRKGREEPGASATLGTYHHPRLRTSLPDLLQGEG